MIISPPLSHNNFHSSSYIELNQKNVLYFENTPA